MGGHPALSHYMTARPSRGCGHLSSSGDIAGERSLLEKLRPVTPGDSPWVPLTLLPTAPPCCTWWAEAVEGGKKVQAGAARVAGLGQALVVIRLTAGACVAWRAEAVEGARGVEAGAAMLTEAGALLGWEERGAGSPQGPGQRGREAKLTGRCGDRLRRGD